MWCSVFHEVDIAEGDLLIMSFGPIYLPSVEDLSVMAVQSEWAVVLVGEFGRVLVVARAVNGEAHSMHQVVVVPASPCPVRIIAGWVFIDSFTH